jgi:molybdenum cofactor biosynthesis enzyme MoaA
VRLTGGEPLVSKDLVDIVRDLKYTAGYSQVAITTNGTLLKRKLPKLAEAGLTHINISLDSLVAAKNEFITRRPNTTGAALTGLDLALELGLPSVKLNVVAMNKFNCDEFGDFVELTRDRPIDVRFIEFMPFS